MSTMLRAILFCALGHASSASVFLGGQTWDRLDAKVLEAKSDGSLKNGTNFHADVQAPTSTTLNPFREGATAAEMTGVQANSAGDLDIFLAGLFINAAVIGGFFTVFSILRRKIPRVYAGNAHDKKALEPSESLFGWIHDSLALRIEDAIEHCGLDQAMMLEFNHFGMKLLSFVAVPMLCVMGPLHSMFGGGRAGDDDLSKLGMANVVDNHPWLYWVHGALVWFVVVSVDRFVCEAQGKFLEVRRAWLKSMPTPRATTILVSRIPEQYQSDKKLKAYFDRLFGAGVVEQVYVVKHTGDLVKLVDEKHRYDKQLQEARFKEEQTGQRATMRDHQGVEIGTVQYYTDRVLECSQLVKEEQKRLQASIDKEEAECFTSNAFVTFKSRRDAEMALKLPFTSDDGEFVCEIPPCPADVIYTDLQRDPTKEDLAHLLGYGLIGFVFWAYMPAVLGIAYVTDLNNLAKYLPVFATLSESESTVVMWDAMAGSLALQLFVSFVPTFFVWIFSCFWACKARAWLQHRIQGWYFWFQVVYVMLVTAVGSSLFATLDQLIENPTSVFFLLASTMPSATHFYLNFIPVQWTTHAQNMLRVAQLFKFHTFKALFNEDAAKQMSEPEDQDYYGIGSRSARQSFVVALTLVFCSLSPLITALGFINCLICRLVYGYLVVYAEIRKPDLGGVFLVTNFTNLQRCMLIYIMLMSGVLCFRAASYGPCAIAGASFFYWCFALSRWEHSYHWEHLPLEDLADSRCKQAEKSVGEGYVQAELLVE